jgi:hypothetical protein
MLSSSATPGTVSCNSASTLAKTKAYFTMKTQGHTNVTPMTNPTGSSPGSPGFDSPNTCLVTYGSAAGTNYREQRKFTFEMNADSTDWKVKNMSPSLRVSTPNSTSLICGGASETNSAVNFFTKKRISPLSTMDPTKSQQTGQNECTMTYLYSPSSSSPAITQRRIFHYVYSAQTKKWDVYHMGHPHTVPA